MNNPRVPVLYSFRRCPYAIRSRMALTVANINCELREILLRDKAPEMLVISGKGTVPVLQLTDGQIIDESLDIMYWALQQSDPQHWLFADREETQTLIEQNDFAFKEKLDRYKYSDRFPEHSQQYYREDGEEFLSGLEQRLDKNSGTGLINEKVSLADVAIFPFIRQFAHVDLDWFNNSPYTHLQRWLMSFKESGLFLTVMKKYKPWTTDSEIVFLGEL